MEEKLKSIWEKVWEGVKSSPAVFGYGIVVGVLVSWIL